MLNEGYAILSEFQCVPKRMFQVVSHYVHFLTLRAVHDHMLFPEGGFYETHQGPRLWWIDPPTDADIQAMVVTLAHRVIRFLKKRGYFQP